MTLPADLAASRQLVKYIKEKVTDLVEVIDEFPNANCDLEFPSCSVTTVGTPKYTNEMPTPLRYEVDPDEPLNDLELTIIGSYDAKYQVDIWAQSKIQRSRLLESVIDSLNIDFMEKDLPCGLSLKLEEYHDIIARYDQVGYTYIDGEDSSQKDQWRVKLDLIVNYPKVAVRSIARINEITITSDIAIDDKLDIEENFTI